MADRGAVSTASSKGLMLKHSQRLSASRPISTLHIHRCTSPAAVPLQILRKLQCRRLTPSSRKMGSGLLCARWLKTWSLLLLLPARLQEMTRVCYASDSSPCSRMAPSSSDSSFRRMNFPSFVNGTDFIS